MQGLQVTQGQIEAINAALPSHTRVGVMESDAGLFFVGSDLLTDCGPGGTYEATASILQSLAQAAFTPKAQPESARTIANRARDRAIVVQQIRDERDRRQSDGGVNVGGKWFKSNDQEAGRYNLLITASLAAGVPGTYVMRAAWRTMQDGVTQDMTANLARQIILTGLSVFSAIDDAAQGHIAAVMASLDPLGYDFSGGWPATFGG